MYITVSRGLPPGKGLSVVKKPMARNCVTPEHEVLGVLSVC